MKPATARTFGAHLKALREAAGFTQEELATIAGISVHAVSSLERGERRRPQLDTVRALAAALDVNEATRDALLVSARAPVPNAAIDEPKGGPLPLALTALLGRDTDLLTLRHWLADQSARLITLTGPGGAGKTRLALELARAIAAEGDTRVTFVPLAAIRNPAFVAAAITEALGLTDVGGLDLPKRARIAYDDRPALLVLDNFEQVLDAASLVADLLSTIASLRVLVTSRAPLRIRGEREYAVGPLGLEADADAIPPSGLAPAPAVRLFVERVRDVQPEFQLTSANGPVVTAICRRLDALPLALELAAPWLKVLTPEDLLRRLMRDVLLSTTGRRDLPERQQTMNATVAWSYQLLAANEQRVFRRLGVLPGRFPIEAAEAVLAGRAESAGATADALGAAAGLIDRSLLLRAETSVSDRALYQMLETVRAFAATELVGAGERDDARAGLARYCIGEARLAAEGLVGPAQAGWLDRVRDDLENYRAALTWLIECRRSAEAADAATIVWRLMFFWVIRGHAAEGLRWHEQILGLPCLSPATESSALIGAGTMWYTQGELDRARTSLIRGLALADGVADPLLVAHAENTLGYVELALGHLTVARDRFTRGAPVFRALGSPWGIANSLIGGAWVAVASGDIAESERLLVEVAPALRQAGPWFQLLELYLRSTLALRRGDPDQAIAFVRASLINIRTLHDTFAFVYALVPLTAAAILKQDDDWAARILGARDAATERTGCTVVDPSVHDLTEHAERDVRQRLGPDRWNEAYAAGRRTSIDSLLAEIDNIL